MIRAEGPRSTRPPPSHAALVGFVVTAAVVTWIVRVWYPVDVWVPLLGIVPAEPAHLPQYVMLFSIGVVAYHNDWLRRIPAQVGLTWLGIGVMASAGVYIVHGLGWWNQFMAPGGLNLSSFFRSTCETLISVSMSLGLTILFRESFHRARPLHMRMAKDSYAAYIIHLYIVIGLQGAVAALGLPTAISFAVVSPRWA